MITVTFQEFPAEHLLLHISGPGLGKATFRVVYRKPHNSFTLTNVRETLFPSLVGQTVTVTVLIGRKPKMVLFPSSTFLNTTGLCPGKLVVVKW